jgi:hypothetical protein
MFVHLMSVSCFCTIGGSAIAGGEGGCVGDRWWLCQCQVETPEVSPIAMVEAAARIP